MSKLKDELKYRMGKGSFKRAEQYEEQKKASRPFHNYHIMIKHDKINVDTIVKSQSPMEAVNAVLKKDLKIDKEKISVQVIPYDKNKSLGINVVVRKIDGIRTVKQYSLIILPMEVRQ